MDQEASFLGKLFRAPTREAFDCALPATDRNVFGQLLFTYELDPRTALFLGYTDTQRDIETADRNLGLRRTSRSFFKLTSAWRT